MNSQKPSKALLAKNFLLNVSLILLTACSQSHEITTWNEWCDSEATTELFGMEGRMNVYNHAKIRQDFIKDYNEILVEELVSSHFWDASIQTNQAAETLIKTHQIGFWVTGNQLHFANTHLTHKEFEGDVERFKTFLSIETLKANKYQLNDFQLCVYKTIDEMYESFIIHTNDETHTIPLEFLYRGFFEK